jgi:hypothetical protein
MVQLHCGDCIFYSGSCTLQLITGWPSIRNRGQKRDSAATVSSISPKSKHLNATTIQNAVKICYMVLSISTDQNNGISDQNYGPCGMQRIRCRTYSVFERISAKSTASLRPEFRFNGLRVDLDSALEPASKSRNCWWHVGPVLYKIPSIYHGWHPATCPNRVGRLLVKRKPVLNPWRRPKWPEAIHVRVYAEFAEIQGDAS